MSSSLINTVMHKLVHPQELEVFYILPALRRDLAVILKEKGMDQKKIAHVLGVSEPSVSHYFNFKRATDITFSHEIQQEIKKTASRLKTNTDSIKETQKLIKLIQSEREICKVCHGINKNSVPSACGICYD